MARRFPNNPLVGVGVVIIQGDRVVMCRRAKPPRAGCWSLPGGGQELGETVRETAVREALEETGLSIQVRGLVDVIDSISHDDDGRIEYHYTLIDFAARVTGGTLRAGDDAAEVAWFTLDEVRALDTWATTIEIIEKAFERFADD
ncbi:MAG: NUDIX hydrolase [Rhodospirillales bacterium]